MLLHGNNVPSTDIIDTVSQRGALAKHELFSVLSLPHDETFISPDKLVQLTQFSNNFFKWHRYARSGRSFSKGFSHKGKLYELMIKGGHLLKNGEIYDPKIEGMYAPPAWGSESVQQLHTEYTAAHDIQNLCLEVFGKPAPLPIPLKVTRLDQYPYKGELEDYKLFMEYVFASTPTHTANLHLLLRRKYPHMYRDNPDKPGSFSLKEEFCSWEILFDMYRRAIGEHGSYQYICEGTSMRLADVFKLPTKTEMQKSIRSFYPGLSDEEICMKFMHNFGKAWGAVYGAGYYFKPGTTRISSCYPVDTTIMGHAMDIDGYEFCKQLSKDECIDMFKKHWLYAEICYLFYHIFFTQDFFDFYKKHFIPAYVDTYMDMSIHRLDKQGEKLNTNEDPHIVRKKIQQMHYNHAKSYITKQVLKKKKLWSEEKYLGNILEVIGLQ